MRKETAKITKRGNENRILKILFNFQTQNEADMSIKPCVVNSGLRTAGVWLGNTYLHYGRTKATAACICCVPTGNGSRGLSPPPPPLPPLSLHGFFGLEPRSYLSKPEQVLCCAVHLFHRLPDLHPATDNPVCF
jgi:hypothetical protein